MYSSAFCRVYNEFGWNYFPEAFSEQLIQWMNRTGADIRTCLDLGCGTGILCERLNDHGLDVSGMDLSENMIAIARESRPDIHYDVADMITYRPDRSFDLVTCTGDALNHIIRPADIETIFRNVYDYLSDGGYFIFDVLNEREVNPGEPFDLDFSETIRAQFLITRDRDGMIRLKTSVYENGRLQFEEVITETIHDINMIRSLLEKCGFRILRCADQLFDEADAHGNTWFVIAQK